MANRRAGRGWTRVALGPESLEGRALPTAGGAGLGDVVQELGLVSRSAAIRGVEATATIAAGHAVTFRFAVAAGGDYTLFVRHDGDGLSLVAKTPAGVATIDAGPAGPFRAVPLRLSPGTYEVTASAGDGSGVFVDWELLLGSGVGQASAAGAAAILPAVAVPLVLPSALAIPDATTAPAPADATATVPGPTPLGPAPPAAD